MPSSTSGSGSITPKKNKADPCLPDGGGDYPGGGAGGGDTTGGTGGGDCSCSSVCPVPPIGPGPCSPKPVRYGVGQIQYVETDLQSRGFGMAWGHSRSYANIIDPNDEGVNGNSWLVKQVSLLTFVGASAGNSEPDEILVVDSGNQSTWFEKDIAAGSGIYKPLFWAPTDLRHDATSKEYALTESSGEKRVFYDNDLSHAAELRGALKQIIDKFGNITSASYDGERRVGENRVDRQRQE